MAAGEGERMKIILTPSEVARLKALVREIVEESHNNHPAVDDLTDLMCLVFKKSGKDRWDCERCGKPLKTVEDFETNRCSSCQEAVELMQIADIRATIKEMRVVEA